jgi:hypothetical protein
MCQISKAGVPSPSNQWNALIHGRVSSEPK